MHTQKKQISRQHFLEAIYTVIFSIPQGKVSTYGDIAEFAGFPGYARHVGKALSQLPDDSTLPWFRVVNCQGKISLSGHHYHRQLNKLLNDGIIVSESGKIPLKHYRWLKE